MKHLKMRNFLISVLLVSMMSAPVFAEEERSSENSVPDSILSIGIMSNQSECESNDYMGSANSIDISTGNVITGSFSTSGDKDWYVFTLNQGTVIDLDIQSTGNLPNTNAWISTYICDSEHSDDSKYIEFQVSGYNDNLGYIHNRDTLYLEKGTYYIQLSSGYAFSYVINIRNAYTWGNFTTNNKYLGQAFGISLGTVYQGMMATYNSRGKIYGDADYFYLDVPETGSYVITLHNIDMKGDWISCPSIDTLDSNGNSINAINGKSYLCAYEGNTESVTAKLEKGRLYFSITPGYYYSPGCGRYEFSFSKVNQEPSTPVVPEVSDGDIAVYGGNTYKIISTTNSTVAFTMAKNTKSITVPATVKIKGKVYKVVQVNANAFKGKKIRTVTTGANVKTICPKALNGSKATTLIIKSKKLTKKSIKGSLKGSKIKTIRVKVGNKKTNKTYVKKYKKIFTKVNAGRKAAVK